MMMCKFLDVSSFVIFRFSHSLAVHIKFHCLFIVTICFIVADSTINYNPYFGMSLAIWLLIWIFTLENSGAVMMRK